MSGLYSASKVSAVLGKVTVMLARGNSAKVFDCESHPDRLDFIDFCGAASMGKNGVYMA